jgi:hypothetical protein
MKISSESLTGSVKVKALAGKAMETTLLVAVLAHVEIALRIWKI